MSEKKQPRPRRTYTSEFKQQLVDLYRSGKHKCDIIKEYDIASSLLDKWIAQADNSGSFKEKDNRTPEEQELLELRKIEDATQRCIYDIERFLHVDECLDIVKAHRKSRWKKFVFT